MHAHVYVYAYAHVYVYVYVHNVSVFAYIYMCKYMYMIYICTCSYLGHLLGLGIEFVRVGARFFFNELTSACRAHFGSAVWGLGVRGLWPFNCCRDCRGSGVTGLQPFVFTAVLVWTD